MTIEVQCGDCFQSFQVRDEFAGRKVRCKSCRSVIQILDAAAAPSPRRKKQRPEDEYDDDYDAPRRSGRRAGSKRSSQSERSFGDYAKIIIGNPLTFLVLAILPALIATQLLPKEIIVPGYTFAWAREIPIGGVYLIVGIIWYALAGGHMDRSPLEDMTYFERIVNCYTNRLKGMVLVSLTFGAIKLEDMQLRILCGVLAAIFGGFTFWQNRHVFHQLRDIRANEWRPTCVAFIGVAYISTPIIAHFRGVSH